MPKFNTMRQMTQAVSFYKHAVTMQTIHKEMEVVWDSLKVDGKELMVTDHMTRRKAQCVQLFARKLMKFVPLFKDFDMFPIAREDIAIGNWRIDSLITQIASNDIESCKHLVELMMTNFYGVPTVMFKFIDENFRGEVLMDYIRDTYMNVEIEIDEKRSIDMKYLEETFL